MDPDDSDTNTAIGAWGSLPPYLPPCTPGELAAPGIASLLMGSQAASIGQGMSPILTGGTSDDPMAGMAALLLNQHNQTQSKNQAAADGSCDPRLTDVTDNTVQPAYQTPKGTIIQLNKPAPATVLPYGDALDNLIAFADATGKKRIWITGGAERKRHSTNSFHDLDKAIDVRDQGTPFSDGMDDETVRNAALAAGYTHGVREIGSDAHPHWHLQIGAGNGLGPEYDLSKGPIKTVRKQAQRKTEAGQ